MVKPKNVGPGSYNVGFNFGKKLKYHKLCQAQGLISPEILWKISSFIRFKEDIEVSSVQHKPEVKIRNKMKNQGQLHTIPFLSTMKDKSLQLSSQKKKGNSLSKKRTSLQ